MSRSILITAGATAAICVVLLLLQSGRNKDLAKQIDTRTESVAQLELRAKSPGIAPGSISALAPNAPLPGSVEAAIAEARANSTPQERIDNAVARIEALVADIGDVEGSPAELFKALPDLLRMIQDLNLDEMIAVAEKIDAPLDMSSSDSKSAMKMIIMMLAAEQDPERMLSNPTLTDNKELQQMVLSSLARKDPSAAREWMASSDLPEREKKQFEQMMAFQLLRTDFASGLEMIRENDDQESMQMLAMMSQFGMPKETLPQVIDAIADPANEELKPQLITLLMNASMSRGGIAAARERVEEMGMGNDDVGAYLQNNINELVQTDPEGAFEWLAEVRTEEQYAEALPDAIESWARDDYNAAGAWLGAMEPSPVKDDAISQYAPLVSEVDPAAAVIWAQQIADETKRTTVLNQTLELWNTAEPDAAAAWMAENGIAPPE